jgi:hypothetical protein
MAGPQRRREAFSNPFFVILLAASLLFVLTALGYLVSPYTLAPDPAGQRHGESSEPPGVGSVALADWLDRNGPLALGIEFVVMLLAGILAMATDPWFSPRSRSKMGQKKA